MKKGITVLLISPLFILLNLAASGQSDMSAFLTAEKSDASKLIGAYISPVIKGVSYGMTNGWYHTGKTHKKLGIDLGVTVSAVMLPSSDQSFDPTKLGLSSNTVPNQNASPTIIGPKTIAATNSYNVNYTLTGTSGSLPISQTINGPDGLDFKKNIGGNWVPVPMIQLGIGLIKNTDLKIRYIPSTNKGSKSGGNDIKMLGFGLMHDIKQYFPGVKLLPFDLSILAAMNSVTGSSSLMNTDQSQDGVPYSNDGVVTYKFSSWIAQAVISKKVSVLTFYAGVGYAAVNTKVNITGTYILDPYATSQAFPITNPFSTTYSNTGMKLNAGMRLKLGPIYFNGDYTIQKYSALTVGFGASIR